jgi:hypothetical protein
MEVQKSYDSILHAPWAHVLGPSLEAAVKRAGSRRLGLPQQPLQIGSPSGRRNMGPRPHRALKNAQGDVIVCGQDDLATAREQLQHWGGRKRSFGHGGCKGSGGSDKGEGGIAREPSVLMYTRSYIEKSGLKRRAEREGGVNQNACTRSCAEGYWVKAGAILGQKSNFHPRITLKITPKSNREKVGRGWGVRQCCSYLSYHENPPGPSQKRMMLVVPVMSSSISILVLCCSCVSFIASNGNVSCIGMEMPIQAFSNISEFTRFDPFLFVAKNNQQIAK